MKPISLIITGVLLSVFCLTRLIADPDRPTPDGTPGGTCSTFPETFNPAFTFQGISYPATCNECKAKPGVTTVLGSSSGEYTSDFDCGEYFDGPDCDSLTENGGCGNIKAGTHVPPETGES
jgi:hypothetical protein